MNYCFEEIADKTAEALVQASTTFRPDQIKAYQAAIAKEDNAHAKWVMETILENAQIAAEKKLPLCDDTGIPHVLLEIGSEAVVPPGFFSAVEEGIVRGLRMLPGRPMAVKGSDIERITQSAGLSGRSEDLALAPVQIRNISGAQIRLTVLMLGGGPEIRGKTQRVFHKHSLEVVLDEIVSWAREGADKLGCLPCTLLLGIGRTNVEAASLALEAGAHGNFQVQSELERRITDAVNDSGIGALNLGGKTTALATFLKVGPQRASGVRVVSLRLGCCFDPRRATISF
ncbi:MAG TPA: fumarate hydratase [Clostridia bacterium]|nr:fumarate hydratase [Clostridia bacterium]